MQGDEAKEDTTAREPPENAGQTQGLAARARRLAKVARGLGGTVRAVGRALKRANEVVSPASLTLPRTAYAIPAMLVVSAFVQTVNVGTPSWMLVLIFAIFGFSAIGWGGLNLIFVSESVRKEVAGIAMGFSLMILLIGNIVGPPIFGLIVDVRGSYSLAWWFLTACSIAAVAVISMVKEDKRVNR